MEGIRPWRETRDSMGIFNPNGPIKTRPLNATDLLEYKDSKGLRQHAPEAVVSWVEQLVRIGHGKNEKLRIWRLDGEPDRAILWPVFWTHKGKMHVSCLLYEKQLDNCGRLAKTNWLPLVGTGLDIMHTYLEGLRDRTGSLPHGMREHTTTLTSWFAHARTYLVLVSANRLACKRRARQIHIGTCEITDRAEALIAKLKRTRIRKRFSPIRDLQYDLNTRPKSPAKVDMGLIGAKRYRSVIAHMGKNEGQGPTHVNVLTHYILNNRTIR